MKRKYIITFLALLLLVMAGITFAWWDSVSKEKTTEVGVGESTTLTMTDGELSPEDKYLVPSGALLGPDDVTEVTITFELSIDKELASSATIVVELVNPDEDLFELDYTLSQTVINAGDTVTLTVTVNLVDDAELVDYSSIQNSMQDILVKVSLT